MLVIIVIALLGVIGSLVWNRIRSVSSTTSTSASKSTQDGETTSINTAEAKQMVSTFYQKYTGDNNDRVTLIKQYGTQALLDAYNQA